MRPDSVDGGAHADVRDQLVHQRRVGGEKIGGTGAQALKKADGYTNQTCINTDI